jgi:oxygen-independent coproporphyrinogen-3 oxidase
MFPERFRSHHDAEQALGAALNITTRGQAEWSELEAELKSRPRSGARGIYIHVPHCDTICSFCNLNRRERKGADLDVYTGYIIDEIRAYGAYPYIREQPFEVVYFGGGTPTVLNTGQLLRILDALREFIPLSKDCEITMESTQHNLGAQKAAALEAGGVNRFSIGIQTFSDRGRTLLGRTYGGEKAREELQALRAAFRGILGIDIIYSYPDQSLEELSRDAEICVSSYIDSVSFYSLMIHRGSALSQSITTGALQFIRDIESDRERHNLFYHTLKDSGFTLLELSKLARPGKDAYRYIHIQYENGDLLPIGSGAGGRLGAYQIYSLSPGRRFISPVNKTYDRYHRMLGQLQFGLYDPELIAGDLGPPAEKALAEKIYELADEGFLAPVPQSRAWALTADGIFWGNNIAVDLLKTVIAVTHKEELVHG